MDKQTTAIQAEFAVGDEVAVVGDEARRACGAERGTVVGHAVPASDSDDPVAVIIAVPEGVTNFKLAPGDLQRTG